MVQQIPKCNGEHPTLVLESLYQSLFLVGLHSTIDISLPGHRGLLLLKPEVSKMELLQSPPSTFFSESVL